MSLLHIYILFQVYIRTVLRMVHSYMGISTFGRLAISRKKHKLPHVSENIVTRARIPTSESIEQNVRNWFGNIFSPIPRRDAAVVFSNQQERGEWEEQVQSNGPVHLGVELGRVVRARGTNNR